MKSDFRNRKYHSESSRKAEKNNGSDAWNLRESAPSINVNQSTSVNQPPVVDSFNKQL